MSLEPADFILQHPSVVGISRRRRLYAALVLGSAILIVMLVCLSFSVREFRAVQVIRFSPKAAARGSMDQASLEESRQHALQVVREVTSEEELRKLVAIWTNRLNLSVVGGGLDPSQVDYEKLRRRLTFALEVEAKTAGVTLQLGYTGRGNLEERAFLKLFSERVAEGLRTWGSPQDGQLAELRAAHARWTEGEQKLAFTARELQDELERVTQPLVRLQTFPLEQLQAAVPAAGKKDEPFADSRRGLLEEKLSKLVEQRDALLREFPESHPEVLAVRREQEQVQLEIMEAEQAAPKRISNQFVQASFPSQPAVTTNAAGEELKQLITAVNPGPLATALERLQLEQNAMLENARQQQQVISSLLSMEPRLEVALSEGQVSVFGALTAVNLMWAMLASMVLGGVIASRFDVWSFDRGFENSRAAQESLAVPVFSWNGELPAAASKAPATASARILKLSEIILFTTLLVVAGMMLIDPEYRVAVWENPLHLIARLLWMWKI